MRKEDNKNTKENIIKAHIDAVKSGALESAHSIMRLLINGKKKFYNNDADWYAEQYLNKYGVFESHIDRNGNYSTYYVSE